jgi:glucose-1-phosphate adenylyltransferase
MENVDIGRHCKVRRAIIDKDVTLPAGTEIGYNLDEDRKRFHVTPSGIVVIGKGMAVEEREDAIPVEDPS